MQYEHNLIDAKRMAEVTSIPISTIWRGCREGSLPHYRFGRTVRFSLVEVLKHFHASGGSDDYTEGGKQ